MGNPTAAVVVAALLVAGLFQGMWSSKHDVRWGWLSDVLQLAGLAVGLWLNWQITLWALLGCAVGFAAACGLVFVAELVRR